MRDFSLVKYAAKLVGLKPKCRKRVLKTYFIYDGTLVVADIFFHKGVSGAIFFDLSLVYEFLAKNEFPSYEAFLDAFVAHSEIYEKFQSANGLVLISDLRRNRLDKVASQALINITILFANLNEFLGRKAEVFLEEDWRLIHRKYLSKQRLLSVLAGVLSIAAALGSVLLNTFEIIPSSTFLEFLSILLIPVGLLAGIGFAIRAAYYAHHLKRANEEKNFDYGVSK